MYPMHPDDIADEIGDGYGSNTLARLFAESRREIRLVSRDAVLAKAKPYLANGLCAVITYGTVYCPRTDGIMGDSYALVGVGSREECEKFAARIACDDDHGAEVISP